MLRTTCSGDATESAAAVAWSVGCSDDDDVTLSDVYDLQTDSSKEFSCVGFELQYESDDMTLGTIWTQLYHPNDNPNKIFGYIQSVSYIIRKELSLKSQKDLEALSSNRC